jgi:hypothetical protein
MSVEIITTALSGIMGLIGVIVGIKNWVRPKQKMKFKIEIDDKIVDLSEVKSELEKELILKVLGDTKSAGASLKADKTLGKKVNQEGYADIEALLLVVPGIIAILFAGTFIYLLIHNQGNPDYSTPKELGAAMTTIIGYYFGIGASSAINKSKTVSVEELIKQLNKQSD